MFNLLVIPPMSMYGNRALFVDLYELTMAQGYFSDRRIDTLSTFEIYYRRNPFNGGYCILAGISDAIKFLKNFKFEKDDIEYLRKQNLFSGDFLDYLLELRFAGEIKGIRDGSIIFPYEPIMQITGSLGITQIIETALLNIINYQSLIATKSSRICYATKQKNNVMEFGLRRAQGDGGIIGSKAAVIGGAIGTSNVLAGKLFNLKISGTHAHSWIQSFPSELAAFRSYAKNFPKSTTLLVDTYNVLKSGIPNAIKVALEMREIGQELKGIRIDSGDLGWLAIESAHMLNQAGLDQVKIVLSSDLDEFIIESIIHQIISENKGNEKFVNNLINRLGWGVGTNLITGSGGKQAAFGGVYKLVEINNREVIKLSENRAKTTIPGKKQLWRIKDKNQKWIADVIGLFDEKPPVEGDTIYHISDPLKYMILNKSDAIPMHYNLLEIYGDEKLTWQESRQRCSNEMDQIDATHLRFLNPHLYKVSLTEKLHTLKQKLLKDFSKI